MKKIVLAFFTLILSGISFYSIAQNNSTITPIQAGTIHITDAKTSVELTEEIKEKLKLSLGSSSYYIVFTHLNDAPQPVVFNKSATSFSVGKSKANSSAGDFDVDYIIYIKEKLKEISAERATKKRVSAGN